ncbi:5'-3' exonuclease H3TH domain-containing protein [Ammoniphilus sp. CFH 90114]|uniref:5'-3' exonuclease n=1 Tax=Ammoniphilus sp. CFH 90114 TaxID=2493665 RepID=UPI0013E96FFF|nr:5'-3' exonuclease H3TH domain-containing protein [Ammoniphilus sp. CFH 90114]
MNSEQNRLLIVDSMALLFRGFYATYGFGSVMQTTSGLYTNAIYQYIKYLLDAVEKFEPTHIICATDMGKATFRNELYPAYKANRGEPPLELLPQFNLVQEVAESFDIPFVGLSGYEADDVMGTFSKKYACKDTHVYILTGDGDTLQLLDDHISVIMMKKGFGNYDLISLQDFQKKKGLEHPSQIIELKGLMGDPSDNIPGCPNVGPKTAEKLLQAYGSIDGVFDSIHEISGKLQQRLIENKEQIYLSRKLAAIDTLVPLDCVWESSPCTFNHEKIRRMFERFEFNSLVKLLA